MNEVGGGVMGTTMTTSMGDIAESLAEIDWNAIWNSISGFTTLWVVLIVFTIGMMLLRRVLSGARKGKAKI